MLEKWVSYACPYFVLLCPILPKFQTLLLGKETLCNICRKAISFIILREAINRNQFL